MKAIIKKEPKEGLTMADVPEPRMDENEVLIKTTKTSICGTDVHLYLWDDWAKKTLPVPCIIGHECVGKIVDMGRSVKGFKVGDRVSIEGHITCGICRYCRRGERVLCPNTKGVGVNRDGCFAEFVSVPAENVFLVPHSIPDEIACIFDPLGNAVHTALSYDLVGKDVLITGAGPIGLMTIPLVKKAGAKTVVITDLNPYRIELAKKMGATYAVNVHEEPLEAVMKTLKIDGFEICLEMSGNAEAFEELPEISAHGAKIVLLGILPSQARLDWHQVIFKMLTIKGIYGREIFRTWFQMTALLESGLDVRPVITHKFSKDEFQKGFDAMLSGASGKVVLDWS